MDFETKNKSTNAEKNTYWEVFVKTPQTRMCQLSMHIQNNT